ncbi:MAG: DUF805 domain-containing protein [Spirochaetaceae bacterium]|nr:MAG: DUF805 domain-containing protein [Spirochaetaceae bacterium]
MKWYLEVLRKYVKFSGRARRTEYWMFFLFNTLISIVLALFERRVQMVPWFTVLYGLAVFLPGCAVAVRRLHDVGKSWTWLLIGLVPIAGGIILIIKLAQSSQPGENRYGLSPEPIEKLEAPLWSIVFFLSILSVLLGFDLWLKGRPVIGIIMTFGIPGILIEILASSEDAIRGRLRRSRTTRS